MIELYRRHGTGCPALTPGTSEAMMSREAKRKYMQCRCPLWVTGTLEDGTLVDRQSCKTRILSEAQAKVSEIVAALGCTAPPTVGTPAKDLGPTLSECSRRYLEAVEVKIDYKTRQAHKLVLRELAEFCAHRSLTHVRQLTAILCDEFVDAMGKERKPTSTKTYAAKFTKFLKWCHRKGHLVEALATRVEPIEIVDHIKAQPYTADEVQRLLAAAPRKIDSLLLELMSSTGMRVSDALQFDPSRCTPDGGDVVYSFRMQKRRRTKQPKWCEVWFPQDLYNRIMCTRSEWRSAALPFMTSQPLHTNYKRVDDLLKSLGSSLGIAGARCHRFRDFFAVDLLTRGVAIGDVSAALHHESVTTTEKFYAAWIPARAKRLGRILREARAEVA